MPRNLKNITQEIRLFTIFLSKGSDILKKTSLFLLIVLIILASGCNSNNIKPVPTELPTNTEEVKTPAAETEFPEISYETKINETTEANITTAVEQVSPAVVNINTLAKPDLKFDPFSYQYYYGKPAEGQGSGVIIDKKGLVLTNAHVVYKAAKILVSLPDGRKFEGKLLGCDKYSDIALVKIEPHEEELPAAKLGNSDSLKIGSWAIAIGNPFGFTSTVTVGVISAVNRKLAAPEARLENLIQTDAAINPGNSGGALVNIYGEVIGINTAIIPYAEGLGFAVPINMAKEVIEELIEKGSISRPFLGIYYYELNSNVAKQFDLKIDKGLLILKIFPGGPAHKAGIMPGDIITKVNGKEVLTIEEMNKIISEIGAGNSSEFEIYRKGKFDEIQVEIGELPPEFLN